MMITPIRTLCIIGGLWSAALGFAQTANLESDAMQITTHFNNLTGIACDNTAQYCVAIGSKLHEHAIDHVAYTTYDGGVTWSHGTMLPHPENEDAIADPLDSEQNLMTIRCSKTGYHCLIAGTTRIAGKAQLLSYTTHDGGLSWSTPHLMALQDDSSTLTFVDDYPQLRLQCDASGKKCILAVNTMKQDQHVPAVFITKNHGESWSEPTFLNVPSNASSGVNMLDFACDYSGLICTALAHTPDGDSQSSDALPAQTALIYSTHDGGLTWSDAKPLSIIHQTQQDTVSKNDVPHILSCDPSGLSCIALGEQTQMQGHAEPIHTQTHAYVTKNGGMTWEDTSLLPSPDSALYHTFLALHCDISNRFCAAVGVLLSIDEQQHDVLQHLIYTTIDAGQTWQKKPFTPPSEGHSMMLDVFCSEDAALCHTVGFLFMDR